MKNIENYSNIVFLNVEPSGLDIENDNIIKCDYVLCDNKLNTLKSEEFWVDNNKNISENVLCLLNATQKEIDAGKNIEDFLKIMKNMLNKKTLLVVYTMFDISFLVKTFLDNKCFKILKNVDYLELYSAFAIIFPKEKNHYLYKLAQRLKIISKSYNGTDSMLEYEMFKKIATITDINKYIKYKNDKLFDKMHVDDWDEKARNSFCKYLIESLDCLAPDDCFSCENGGVSSLYEKYNEFFGNFQNGRLIAVYSRPTLADNFFNSIFLGGIYNNKNAIYIYQEMNFCENKKVGDYLKEKILKYNSNYCNSFQYLCSDKNNLKEQIVEKNMVIESLNKNILEEKITFCGDCSNLDEIVNKIRFAHKNNNIKFAVVQDVQYIMDSKNSRKKILSMAALVLKNLAIELNIPIFINIDLSKKHNLMPTYNNLMDYSRRLVNVADEIITINRAEFINGAIILNSDKMEVIVYKNLPNRATGSVFINCL